MPCDSGKRHGNYYYFLKNKYNFLKDFIQIVKNTFKKEKSSKCEKEKRKKTEKGK